MSTPSSCISSTPMLSFFASAGSLMLSPAPGILRSAPRPFQISTAGQGEDHIRKIRLLADPVVGRFPGNLNIVHGPQEDVQHTEIVKQKFLEHLLCFCDLGDQCPHKIFIRK